MEKQSEDGKRSNSRTVAFTSQLPLAECLVRLESIADKHDSWFPILYFTTRPQELTTHVKLSQVDEDMWTFSVYRWYCRHRPLERNQWTIEAKVQAVGTLTPLDIFHSTIVTFTGKVSTEFYVINLLGWFFGWLVLLFFLSWLKQPELLLIGGITLPILMIAAIYRTNIRADKYLNALMRELQRMLQY